MASAPIFAHLHSSPLVVRRLSGNAEWRSLSSSTALSAAPSLDAVPLDSLSSSGLEPVDIIDVKEERKLLVQCLREAKKQIVWHSEVADLHTFRKVLSFGCRALHFSGHGVPGKVIFENKKCEAQFISKQELKDLLLAGGMELRQASKDKERALGESRAMAPAPPTNKSRLRAMLARRLRTGSDQRGGFDGGGGGGGGGGGELDIDDEDDEELGIATTEVERGWISLHPPPRVPVKLVFLSACHSESVAEAFVTAGVPHVVVVSKDDKVLDKKAMEFSKAFYTALFAGHSVARAFEIGQVQADISITSTAGNSKFKLLGHGDHTEALFRDAPEGSFSESSLPPTGNDCDAVAEVFVGRSLEIHQVYKSLVEGARLVSITGNRGIGKTEIALQCARYTTERRVFKHIYFMRLEESLASASAASSPSSYPTNHLSVGGLVPEASIVSRIARAFGTTADNELDLANFVRQLCVDGSYLLILDGCNRKTRRDPQFRLTLAQLLRRVSELSILVTGDGKIGAMDGVGEKIIHVDHLPPADAALLFTLRAPRRLKAHEMGGSSDLLVLAEHPIIRNLMGHPRSICAVAQFLEKKDMELDKHEFLNYIIPSVTAGLALDQCDDDRHAHSHCFPVLPQDCHIEAHPHHAHHHSHDQPPAHGHGHPYHPHHLHQHGHHHERWASMPAIPLSTRTSLEDDDDDMASTDDAGAALSSQFRAQLKLETSQSDSGQQSSSSSADAALFSRPRLEGSQSEGGLFRPDSPPHPRSTPLTDAELCVLKIASSLKPVIDDEDGRLVWANAVVANSGLLEAHVGSTAMQHLDAVRTIPMDWLAPFISRYFATKLKADAAKRPLSVRSIDFLTKSALVWGMNGQAPAQLNGAVELEMFAHFWQWFPPLTECIAYSKLWSYTQPRLLHGFLSKGACVTMLQRAPPGTFLIRFSETRLRCFVIVYVTDQQGVQFVPVTCKTDSGQEGWYVSLQEDGSGVSFATIQDLILSVTVLKFLFPQTPKEIAFATY